MDVYRSKKVLFDGALRPMRLYVQNGKIIYVKDGYDLPENTDDEELVVDFDFGTLVMMPGLVDSAVHTNDPGRAGWEGSSVVSTAAAKGGFTSIVDLPVFCVPSTNSVEMLARKMKQVRGKSYVDVSFLAGVHAQNIPNIRSLIKSGVSGFKCWLGDPEVRDIKPVDVNTLEQIMRELNNSDMTLHIEANLAGRDRELPEGTVGTEYKAYMESKPDSIEIEAVNTVIEAMHNSNSDVKCHINNVASGAVCEIIKEAQADDLPLTADTTCYYLGLNLDNIEDGATQFKANPPIRDEENQELLWDGLKEGTLLNICSNHVSLPTDIAKTDRGNFLKARAGIDSLQFALPLMWTVGRQFGVTLDELHKLMSEGPATATGLEVRKGTFEPGFDADMVIWDPQETFTVTEDMMVHSNTQSPYLGMKLKGVVKQTIVRGHTIYEDGKMTVLKPPGRLLLAGELGDEVGRFGTVAPGGPEVKRRLSLTPQMIKQAFVPGEEGQYRLAGRRKSYYQ